MINYDKLEQFETELFNIKKKEKEESVKYCENCKHRVRRVDGISDIAICRRPLDKISCVNGQRKTLNILCEEERANEDGCGINAKYYEN